MINRLAAMDAFVHVVDTGFFTDAGKLAEYGPEAKAAGGHPLKLLAPYGKIDLVEGERPEGAVIIEFPDMAAARAWYDSPAFVIEGVN